MNERQSAIFWISMKLESSRKVQYQVMDRRESLGKLPNPRMKKFEVEDWRRLKNKGQCWVHLLGSGP